MPTRSRLCSNAALTVCSFLKLQQLLRSLYRVPPLQQVTVLSVFAGASKAWLRWQHRFRKSRVHTVQCSAVFLPRLGHFGTDHQEMQIGRVPAGRIDRDAHNICGMGCLTEAFVCLSTPASTKVKGDPAKALLRTWTCVWMEDSGTSPASTLPPARWTEHLRGGLALLEDCQVGASPAEHCIRTSYTGGALVKHAVSPARLTL